MLGIGTVDPKETDGKMFRTVNQKVQETGDEEIISKTTKKVNDVDYIIKVEGTLVTKGREIGDL